MFTTRRTAAGSTRRRNRKTRALGGKATAYVCRAPSCDAPTSDPRILKKQHEKTNPLPKDFFRRDQMKLKTLADDLLVFVECDQMSDEVREDLFIYGAHRPSFVQATKSQTAIVGLRKRGRARRAHGYVEWFANKQAAAGIDKTSRSKTKRQQLRMIGQKIGENLGTMWELGTSKMSARPWWRPAVQTSRGKMLPAMADALRGIIGGNAK